MESTRIVEALQALGQTIVSYRDDLWKVNVVTGPGMAVCATGPDLLDCLIELRKELGL